MSGPKATAARGISDRQARRAFAKTFDVGLGDLLMDEVPPGRHADLSLMEVRAPGPVRTGEIDVGIRRQPDLGLLLAGGGIEHR